MKHTPGPWGIEKARTYDDLNRECLRIYGPGDINIAKVSGDITKENANARLIAAAPELLEVCNAVLEWQKAFLKLDFDLEKKLRQAIAKAAGVTNEKESN